MKSVKSKSIFLTFLLGGFLFASQAYAAGEESGTQMASDLSIIKTRLETLENQQKEILAKEDKILEELDRIRIWVHRK